MTHLEDVRLIELCDAKVSFLIGADVPEMFYIKALEKARSRSCCYGNASMVSFRTLSVVIFQQ